MKFKKFWTMNPHLIFLYRTHSMIEWEEWLTIKLLSTLRTTTWFVSVSPSTPWRNGFQHGPKRPRRISIFSHPGSQRARLKTSLWDQSPSPTGTGPIMPPEANLESSLVWLLSESSQSRTSTSDAGYLTSTLCSSSLRDSEEVWDIKDQLWCTTISSMLELWWTIQISSGGTLLEFSQRTHQFQMLIESGELDKLQSSINTTRPVTDTELESQDMFHGTALKINQSCHILWMLVQMLSTVPSRETATPLPHSSEDPRAQDNKYIFLFKQSIHIYGVLGFWGFGVFYALITEKQNIGRNGTM